MTLLSSLEWTIYDETLYKLFPFPSFPSPSHLACFDLDHTLIKPLTRSKYPQSGDDWDWLFPSIPFHLAHLRNQGFQIIIFSNQAGIESGSQSLDDLKFKINAISKIIKCWVLIASAKDHWRKPSPDMWTHLISYYQIDVEKDQCFYIGDAAGRTERNDFSDTDRKFAFNIGIRFFTPEEFFLNQPKMEYKWYTNHPSIWVNLGMNKKGIDQKELNEIKMDKTGENEKNLMTDLIHLDVISNAHNTKWRTSNEDLLLETIGKKIEIIVMVGIFGSGKTHFCETHLIPKQYIYIDQSHSQTKPNLLNIIVESLRRQNSVVIDDNHPTKSSRKMYIELAKKMNVGIRIFQMKVDLEICQHCNILRERIGKGRRKSIDQFKRYQRLFQSPRMEEGMDDICTISWIAQFKTLEEQAQFLLWLN